MPSRAMELVGMNNEFCLRDLGSLQRGEGVIFRTWDITGNSPGGRGCKDM